MQPFNFIVNAISSHALLIAIVVVFLITTLYYRSALTAHRQMSQLLQRQLQVEANSAKRKLVQHSVSTLKTKVSPLKRD